MNSRKPSSFILGSTSSLAMADTGERDTQADVSNLAMECNTGEDQPINKDVISMIWWKKMKRNFPTKNTPELLA